MRKAFYLLALLLGYTYLQAQERVVEQPAFDVRNTNSLEIQKIVLNDTATIFYIDAYYRPKNWIRIAKTTVLETNGKSYPIQSGVGIELDKEFWMPESGTASFQLVFAPLPKEAKTIDFVEGYDEGAFRIWGIHLDGSPAISPLAGKKNPQVKAVLEKPELKAGTGILTGKLVGYRSDMDLTLDAYAFNIIKGEADEYKIPVQKDGSFKFEIPLLHISIISLRSNIFYTNLYLKPDETSSIEVNLPEICRQSSKIQDKSPSLGEKFYFDGALATLNNELSNAPEQGISLYPETQEEYMQMMKEVSTMTVDQFKACWTERYQKALEKLNQQEGLSDVQRQLKSQSLKHNLAENIMNPSIIEYYYRQLNNIPRDSVLTDYIKPIPTKSYYSFLPELISNDSYFLYDGNSAYLLKNLQYANLTGKERIFKKDEPLPDNTADIAELMGTDQGILFELLAAQRIAGSIQEFKPLSDVELSKADKLDPAIKAVLVDMNDKLKQTIEENKKKSGYTVNRINTADIPAEELFNAITTPYRGKVVFVDFWATWCGPCKSAMKEAEPVKKDFADKEVVFLYLAGENSPIGAWNQMIPDIKGEHYRVTQAQWDYMGKKFGVQGVPSYMIIARDGTPVHFQVGFMGVEKMKEMLNKELVK